MNSASYNDNHSQHHGNKLSIACRHLLFTQGEETIVYVGRKGEGWYYLCTECRLRRWSDEGPLRPDECIAICDDCIEETLPLMTILETIDLLRP
jgi:hypothetical protein